MKTIGTKTKKDRSRGERGHAAGSTSSTPTSVIHPLCTSTLRLCLNDCVLVRSCSCVDSEVNVAQQCQKVRSVFFFAVLPWQPCSKCILF